MNANVVKAVARRELRSWFGNPTNYVFIILFVLVSAIALMFPGEFFRNNLANLDTLNAYFPLIALVFVAAATMGMWTSERANGTQELLFTLPAKDSDLLFGKFFAYVGVYTASLLFTLPLPIALMMLGSPDWGQLFANYVGYWLFGVALVSVSMLGSQLTGNATVAFILSAGAGALVVYLGSLLAWLGFRSWAANGTLGQFAEFARGMIPTSGLVLFLGLTLTFLYLNLALLARRHWRGSEGGHSVVRSASFAVATFALTIIAVHVLPRVDATIERIHSLGADSKKLIADLPADKQILIKAFVSEEVPEALVQQRRLLLNLIDQFDSLGGNRIEKDIVIPVPYSPEANDAENNYGIHAQTIPVELPSGGYSEMQVFLGFVVACGTEEVVTAFVEPGLPLEYELSRSIRVVAKAERKKIGVLKSDVELVGGFDFQTFQQKQKWLIADEIDQQYATENVDPDKDYPADLACLLVPQPSSLPQEQMDRLQQWILAGHPTLLFEDPVPRAAPGTAADDQKGGMQARMMGGQPPEKGNLDAFFASFGLRMPKAEVVWDTSSRGFFGGQVPSLAYLFEGGPAVAADSVITSGLQSVVWILGGHFESLKKEGITYQALVSSPDPAVVEGSQNGVAPKYESMQGRGDGVMVFDFFGGQRENPRVRYRPSNKRYDLVVRVGGKPAGAAQNLNLICWSDLDAISNIFFGIRRQATDQNMRFDNVPLVLNCIDSLVGDESLIELRKRRPLLRRLTAVEKAQSEFEKRWTKQKEDAEEESLAALDAAKKRLDSAVQAIRDDQTLDANAKENKVAEIEAVENRRFELEKADIEAKKRKTIEHAQFERDRDKGVIQARYRLLTLSLAIVPPLLLGILTLIRRMSRAAAIVPQARMVGGGKQ